MSTEAVLTAFTGIAALALLLQGLALWGIRSSLRTVSSRVETVTGDIQKKFESVATGLTELLAILKPLAQNLETIEHHVAATTETVHKRVADLDSFLEDTTDAARLQVAKIQDLVDTMSTGVEETFDFLQKGVRAPVTEFSALIRGIKVGLDFFMRGRRRPTRPSHQDEEMFI